MIGGLPQSVPNPGQSQGSPAPVNLVPGNPHIIGPGDDSTLTYGYDALGRLTSEGQPFGSLTYAYDAAGDQTQITWADSFYVNYNYDMIGSVTSIQENGATSGVGVLATYTFDNLGRRTAVAYGNGTGRSYAYDAVGRLAGLGLSFPNGGNNQLIGGIGGSGTPISYTPSSQIASLSRSNNSYVWTGVYNVSRTYTANGLNQYTAAGGTSFSYDARGNLSTSGTSTYSYSKLNELASVPAASANIYYDPLSRITEYDASSSTRFYYSGSTPVAEVANPSGAVTQRYVPGPGTDEPIVWYVGSGTSQRRFLQSDERGSINAVTDSSGNVLAINSYDEYGIPASSNVGRFGYTGQTWFPEVGLYNYKARWYSPTLGRFMQTDPIGYGAGLNWYNYAQGDPINGRDPTGLETQDDPDNGDGGDGGGGGGNPTPTSPPSCPDAMICVNAPTPPPCPDDMICVNAPQPAPSPFADPAPPVLLPPDFPPVSFNPPVVTSPPQSNSGHSFRNCLGKNWRDAVGVGLDIAALGVSALPGASAAVKTGAGLVLGGYAAINTVGGMAEAAPGSSMALANASLASGTSGMAVTAVGAANDASRIFSVGSKVAAAIPGVGTALGVVSLGIDGYTAYADISSCIAGK